MVEECGTNSKANAARALDIILSRVKATNARLDADSTSALTVSDIDTSRLVLQPAFDLSDSLASCKSVELEEALVYLSEAKLCELLLSLLRRWPWAEMAHKHLTLLPRLLCALRAFLCVAAHVPSSQQAEAYAEMRKRCLPHSAPAHTWLCCKAAQTRSLFCLCLASSDTSLRVCQVQDLAGVRGDDRHCCQLGRIYTQGRA